MRSIFKCVAALILMAVLFGCAGTNFTPPSANSLVNGHTTYDQVVEKMGSPRTQGTITTNGKTIKSISYSYGSAVGKPLHEGVTPARAMVFYFYDGVLVGHEFISSWAEDSTDFDDKKIDKVTKGKTTKAEVISLLGQPNGSYIYPVTKSETGDAIGYIFVEVRNFYGMKVTRKSLQISFDPAGVVKELNFAESGM